MAARLVSATAATAVRYRPRARGTRCNRRFRTLKPAASIAERRASLRVDRLSRPESPCHGPGLLVERVLERIPFQSKSQCSILPPLRGVRFLLRPLSAFPREDYVSA